MVFTPRAFLVKKSWHPPQCACSAHGLLLAQEQKRQLGRRSGSNTLAVVSSGMMCFTYGHSLANFFRSASSFNMTALMSRLTTQLPLCIPWLVHVLGSEKLQLMMDLRDVH